MPPIEKKCPTWAYHHCFGEPCSCFMQHVFYQWGCPRMGRWGYSPSSSVKITLISKQYFVLGWLDSGPWTGDKNGEWVGELSSPSCSHWTFTPWVGTSMWPSAWSFAPDILSTRLLDLAAIDTKLVATNWNSRYSQSLWAQGLWQEII